MIGGMRGAWSISCRPAHTRRVLPRSQQLCLLVPFLGIGLTLGWIHAIHGETRVYRERVEDLSFVLTTSGWIYLRELVHIVLYLGLVLWPLTWGIVTSLSLRAVVWATGVIAILCGPCLWHEGRLNFAALHRKDRMFGFRISPAPG